MSEKKKIKTLNKDDDFYELFGVEKEKQKEENFEELLTEFEKKKKYDREVIEEKERKIKGENTTLTKSQKLKLYPKPQSKLDLHGLTVAEAEEITEKFILNSKIEGLKTVIIITGKGHHSQSGPVLRNWGEGFVNKMKREKKIFEWQWDNKQRGKSGSIIVFLN